MERKEYLVKEYINYLKTISKEEILSSFMPVIEQLSIDALEKLIETGHASVIPYHLANKDEIIKQLMTLEKIEVDAYIDYDDWSDPIYKEDLDRDSAEFFVNAIRLMLYFYRNKQKTTAYQLVKKLYSIKFVCNYYDDEDEIDYHKTYLIDYFDLDLGRIIYNEKVEDIYIEAVINDKDIDALINILLTKFSTYDFVDLIRQQDPSLLYPLGEKIIENKIDSWHARDLFYLFDVIDDYFLYLKAVNCFFDQKPEILVRFINTYYDDPKNNHNYEIENIVYQKIMSINKGDDINESVLLDVLNLFPREDFILKYYALFNSDKAFIILNCLDDGLFYKSIRKSDKKWLLIASDLFIDGYDDVKHIVRAIFKKDEDNCAINAGQKNYLRRAKYNKNRMLSDLARYVVELGKDYNSKTYYHYYDYIKEIMKDIDCSSDLIKIVKEAYPNRLKLQEIFNN